jgi:phage terminase large subunit
MNFDKTDTIWCDSSRPELIEDLKRKRINAKPVIKNTILHGIDLIKRHEIYLHQDSVNLIDEFQNYKWKTDKDGRILDAAEDKFNHAIDSVRYALEMSNKPKTKYSFR